MKGALLAFAGLAACLGFAALALAMDRHFEGCFGRGRQPGRLRPFLRVGGALGLAASLLASIAARGAAQGWVLWFGVMTAAAMAVVLVLSCAPATLPRSAQARSEG